MELPRRARGDELLRPGELSALRARLRHIAPQHDLSSVIACAFDHRTRMLPFIYADMRMTPAGVRAIGSAMADAGFHKTRIVLQQWNPNFRPSLMRLDGRLPDLFMVSSMQIHCIRAREMIYDACGIDESRRPLIIAGGPKYIYEPWDAFSADRDNRWAADVAITGEEFVLLKLIETLLEMRAGGETIRSTFVRDRNSGMLDHIPGLVYARSDRDGVVQELVDTGIQKLVGDLDELPAPSLGYQLLEPPSRRETLGLRAVPADRIRKLSPVGSLVLTFGCKFACPYCPIPAYNQRQHRLKSGERVVDEMRRLYTDYGIRYFFGADDNFFNHKQRTLDMIGVMARSDFGGKPIRKCVRWGTEVTVHDTLELRDHLADVRAAGVRALWLGVEDMTATLVKKGQTVGKTVESFRLLQSHGICPMPMMMHHDSQPLYTAGRPYGLLNQVRILRKAGAISMQVLMITPATGSKIYEETFTSGMAFSSVGGQRVEEHMLGGCHVVASQAKRPWVKQFNIIAAYLYFYNPLRFLKALVRPRSKLYLADSLMQFTGMRGTAQTIRRTIGWAIRLAFGKISRHSQPPHSRLPMRAVNGETASHALPVTASMPAKALVQLGVTASTASTAS